ncbi:hypothetical protein HHI36_001778 [Cryptolaemus montrouzieri]|uniref:Uncharacterized protein n=1 Tax=Cryptolaemus montrouzieri TaxID=559131 RepID=A0ABD2P9A3_9CUCU
MMIPYKGTKASNRRQCMQNYPKKWWFKIFVRCDVVYYLKNEKNLSLGTVTANRVRSCTLKSDKELGRAGRGSFDQKVDNNKNVAIVK